MKAGNIKKHLKTCIAQLAQLRKLRKLRKKELDGWVCLVLK
jgi:hypothetical protein